MSETTGTSMNRNHYKVFSEGNIAGLTISNRLVRSATWDPSILTARQWIGLEKMAAMVHQARPDCKVIAQLEVGYAERGPSSLKKLVSVRITRNCAKKRRSGWLHDEKIRQNECFDTRRSAPAPGTFHRSQNCCWM
ncbi:MAG: hypothetical protein MUC85_04855, partial [Anaerolineales bacterium]|nr:hypothetical protein [Anaerolineales bacterium]